MKHRNLSRWIALSFILMCVALFIRPDARAEAEKPGPYQALSFLWGMYNAPWPYNGLWGDTTELFFDTIDPKTGERFHTTEYDRRYSEKEAYSDNHVLFHIPATFDPTRPFVYVVFFHGIRTTVKDSVRAYKLIEQINASGRNAILIVPPLAVNAADTSCGKFYMPGAFRAFMDEAGAVAMQQLGDQRGRDNYDALFTAPVVLVPFSGGYRAAAYVLERGGIPDRIRGVLLLDALYSEIERYQDWLLKTNSRAFFISVYSEYTEKKNKKLMKFLDENKIAHTAHWPQRDVITHGVYMYKTGNEHEDIPTQGAPEYPLAALLNILPDSAPAVQHTPPAPPMPVTQPDEPLPPDTPPPGDTTQPQGPPPNLPPPVPPGE